MNVDRRSFFKCLGGLGAAAVASGPLLRAFAEPAVGTDEFFVFIHASGGWDVTVSLDPRWEAKGLIDPATTRNLDYAVLKKWREGGEVAIGERSFAPVQPAGSKIVFGPAIGDLGDKYDRLTVINGIAVNTVSHADGTVFAATGRHLAGGRVPASSIDTVMAHEFGTSQILPAVSVRFPSSFVGHHLDQRAMPLVVDGIGSMGRSLARSNTNLWVDDRDAVTALLTEEANDLALRSNDPQAMKGFALQLAALQRMTGTSVQSLFDSAKLRAAQPSFNYSSQYMSAAATNAAFAVEAMKANLVRSVSFSAGGFDTHNNAYVDQGQKQQELFDVLARLIEVLDETPHPTRTGRRLSDHTHIMVVSEFCRTPQINPTMGRDHYPNGSALVISPRFNANMVYGSSDPEQLLPQASGMFYDGERALTPADLLATFVGAFGIDPRRHMRDGEVIKELVRA
jgi:hypothetical protein